MSSDFFSHDYFEARGRFVSAADLVGARLDSYPIDDSERLVIDVARIPARSDRVVVVSSGVHGVEAPFGAAVQLAWLHRLVEGLASIDTGVVLIHCVNPFGFAHHRRWNEENVDLNRNFLDPDQAYRGAPPGYVKLNSLLNPASPPSRSEPFRLKAFANILRHGIPAIKEAVATGQYDFPQGLFFGGSGPCASTRIVQEHYGDWVGDALRIVHLDFHTGLGRFADYKLLIESGPDSDEARWFTERLSSDVVEPSQSEGTSYQARGTMGGWIKRNLSDRDVCFATAEFGTYGLVRVVGALRAENRAYHHSDDPEVKQEATAELRECFCPVSDDWRNRVLTNAVDIVERCLEI